MSPVHCGGGCRGAKSPEPSLSQLSPPPLENEQGVRVQDHTIQPIQPSRFSSPAAVHTGQGYKHVLLPPGSDCAPLCYLSISSQAAGAGAREELKIFLPLCYALMFGSWLAFPYQERVKIQASKKCLRSSKRTTNTGEPSGALEKAGAVTYAGPETYWAAIRPPLLTCTRGFSIATARWCFLSNYKLYPCLGFPSELSH